MIARTKGEVRGYVLFGELFGFVLFRISISKLIVPILSFVFIKIADINLVIRKIINDFYEKIESVILKMITYIFKMLKSVKKLLKNTLGLLYTNKNIINAEKTQNETKT